MLEPDRMSPRGAAVFAVNMLVNTAAGRSYAEDEYREWMRAAGLTDLRRVPLAGPTSLVIGRRP